MQPRGRVSIDRSGSLVAVVDGDQLLAYDAKTGAPRFHASLHEALLGVAIAGDEIIVVAESGRVARLDLRGGARSNASLDAAVRCFAVRADGTIAAAHDDRVSILATADLSPTAIACAGITALAWSQDGRFLFAATTGSDGASAIAIDASSGATVGEPTALSSDAAAIAPSARGGILVACGDRLVRVTSPGAPLEAVSEAGGKQISDVAVSRDGTWLAMQLGGSVVAVRADPPKEALVDLTFAQPRCTGIAFGARPWICVALEGGDVDLVNVETGELRHSRAHAGRPQRQTDVQIAGVFQAAKSKVSQSAWDAAEKAGIEKGQRMEANRRAFEAAQQHSPGARLERRLLARIVFFMVLALIGAGRLVMTMACHH